MIDPNTTSAIGVLTRNFYALDQANDAASSSMADDDAEFLDPLPSPVAGPTLNLPIPPAGHRRRPVSGEVMVTVEAIMTLADVAAWLGYSMASTPQRIAERNGYAIMEDAAGGREIVLISRCGGLEYLMQGTRGCDPVSAK